MIAAVFNNSNCGVGLAYNAKLGGKTNSIGSKHNFIMNLFYVIICSVRQLRNLAIGKPVLLP